MSEGGETLLTNETGCGEPSDHDGFQEYRAPRENVTSLVQPSFDEVPTLLQENLDCLALHGEPFTSLRKAARQQLIDGALRYTSAYRDVEWVDDWKRGKKDAPIIMAGHQPAIFHPGVWFKNFALSHLAENTGGLGINLVVDNDVASSSGIRVPTVDSDTGIGSYRSVSYDDAGGGVPYEQTTIRNRDKFDRFDRQVAEAIRPLVADPCVEDLWHHAQEAIARCGVAGCALAQARHGLEGQLGLRTLELPLGVICRTPAFAEFVLSILDEMPRFQSCYNNAAGRYRRAHKIRSTAHPVPDLADDGEWFEAPLWIYGDDSPQRRAAWVRRMDDQLLISDRAGRELSIDARFPKLAAEQMASHASPNFKLRPRALLTTMYSRLVLSDLFVHGIGGGKYDQLGDLIIRQFFGIEPPKFMVISATIRLPGHELDPGTSAHHAEIIRLKRAIRDTLYQAENLASRVTLSELDVEQKRRLLASVPPRGERRLWQREIEAVNGRLAEQTEPLRSELRQQLHRAEQGLATDTLLSSREHPFCLFPLDYLEAAYRDLLRQSSN